jgi:hypothetical protein
VIISGLSSSQAEPCGRFHLYTIMPKTRFASSLPDEKSAQDEVMT